MNDKTYPVDINGVHRELPIIKLDDKFSIASFVILGDCEIVVAAAQKLKDKLPEADFLMTAEAKGISLTHELARPSACKCFIYYYRRRADFVS